MTNQTRRAMHRRVRLGAVTMTLAALAGCSRNKVDTGEDYRPDPIPVHVQNENFLDMNVYVVVSGVARRLGMVTGNGKGEFKIDWNVAYGQSIVLRAVPIGGSGGITSPALTVSEGQEIEFRIASTLRQSTAVVREP